MSLPVKVCGITRLEDAITAIDCGAQAVGFIFHKPSPRYIAPERARGIIAALPPYMVTVGVVVKLDAAEINRIAEFCRLDRIQLHGGEPAELLRQLQRPAYRAFRLRGEADLARVEAAPEETVMLDSYDADHYGGTGRPFNWEWARTISTSRARPRRVILAGGLNPENVAMALEEAQPAALDVSSGVEVEPGIKDPAKIGAFFRAVSGHTFTTTSPWSAENAGAN